MLSFLIKRLLQSLVVLLVLSMVIFGLLHFMPGDPLEQYIREFSPSKEQIEAYIQKKGLDKPFYIQYLTQLNNFIHFDFGVSERYQVEVSSLLGERILTTLKLTVPVFLFSILLAIPLGVFSAVYQYSKLDFAINLLIFIGISATTFWLGLMVIYLFSLKLRIFPPGGIQTINVFSIIDQAKYLVLPILVLSIHGIASWTRYFRASLLEVLNLDYIRTARAKGLNEDKVIFKHALKNALIPMLTLVALSIPQLFSGALVTEQIFSIPGMGQLLLTSIMEKDREMALTAFLFLSLLTLSFNLIADILYGVIDPRIKRK